MPEQGHKGDFPSREAIREFLATLRSEPGAMFKALDGVAHGTVEKWYRDKDKGGTEISATNLLRVVLSLGAVAEFTKWLAAYASPVGETSHLTPVRLAELDRESRQLKKEVRRLERENARNKVRADKRGRSA